MGEWSTPFGKLMLTCVLLALAAGVMYGISLQERYLGSPSPAQADAHPGRAEAAQLSQAPPLPAEEAYPSTGIDLAVQDPPSAPAPVEPISPETRPMPDAATFLNLCLKGAEDREGGAFGSSVDKSFAEASCQCRLQDSPPEGTPITQDEFIRTYSLCEQELSDEPEGFLQKYKA